MLYFSVGPLAVLCSSMISLFYISSLLFNHILWPFSGFLCMWSLSLDLSVDSFHICQFYLADSRMNLVSLWQHLPLNLTKGPVSHLFSDNITHMRSTNRKPQPSNQFPMDKIKSHPTFFLSFFHSYICCNRMVQVWSHFGQNADTS